MRTNPYITRAILLGTAFAASSCMMGPDFKPVDMPMPALSNTRTLRTS